MPTPQVSTAFTQQLFPSGTPTTGDIRYELRVASTLQVLQTVNAPVGDAPVFTQPADGTFLIRAQRHTGTALIGPMVASENFTIDSRVSLAVPATITVTVV